MRKKLNEIFNLIDSIDINLLKNVFLYLKDKKYLKSKNDNEIEEIIFYLKELKFNFDSLVLLNLDLIEEENLKSNKKMISLRIDLEDYLKLKSVAEKKKISISELIRKILKNYLRDK
jgi:hypothetical protein